MVRCDDFYCKWQKVGNFCEKHPRTAEQIDAYLNKILPLLEELAAKSEILNDGSRAIAPELSETASRPLISERDPEIRQKAMEQIVKKAEEKVMDGKKPQVTNREVQQIVQTFRPSPDPASEVEPKPEQLPNPIRAVKEWSDELQSKADVPAIPKYITDLLDFKEIKAMLEELSCPCCGAPASGNLVWKCCGSTLDNAIEKAEAKVDKRFDELNAASRARREAAVGRS